MTNKEHLTLENCEKEPIHIIGQIQSVGFFLLVSPSNFNILQVSKNLIKHFDLTLDQVLNKNIDSLRIHGLKEIISTQSLAVDNTQPHPHLVTLPNGDKYNLLIHNWKDNYALEFEPQVLKTDEYNLQYFLGGAMGKIHNSTDYRNLLNETAEEIKKITGYDRVMIYKFHEDWHGEVVAECKIDELDPYYGLHYPASDIPKRARDLFTINPVRFIHDVQSEPVEIYPAVAEGENEPTDLTHSTLRSSSQMHIQYLKNMGVGASMTISLLVNDKLWGMIACHHREAKFIDFKLRQACQFMGQLFSSSLQLHLMDKEKDDLAKSREIGAKLASFTLKEYSITQGLAGHDVTLQDLIECSGAAVVTENQIISLGNTPSEADITNIIRWLNLNQTDDIFITDEFSKYYSSAINFKDKAAGLIAARLSSGFGEYLLWFKSEVLQTIYWGGNPEKAVTVSEDGMASISPRVSFDKWAQIMENKSEAWTNSNISAVVKLREDVLQVILKKANEIRKLHDQLEEAYKELDAFSYTVSHDLRTPLTAIKVYSEILLEENDELFTDSIKDMLNKVVKNADKMTDLIKDVLNYSKIGKVDTSFKEIEVKELLPHIIDNLETSYKSQKIEFVLGDLPVIYGDETMINQVFSNLLSNAVKYSQKRSKSIVKVSGTVKDDEVIYTVADNGIGIDMQHIGKIFQIFSRLTDDNGYEGNGVGMTIVKRIMDKHNGKIWIESSLNKGASFFISFPKKTDNLVDLTA